MRLSAPRVVLAIAVVVAVLSACGAPETVNGGACLKNDDCESKHCIANVCKPQPLFGGSTSSAAGSGGASATGGSGGSDQDASTD